MEVEIVAPSLTIFVSISGLRGGNSVWFLNLAL